MSNLVPAVLLSAQDGDVLVLRTPPISARVAPYITTPLNEWFKKHGKDVLVLLIEDGDVVLTTDDVASQIRELVATVQ